MIHAFLSLPMEYVFLPTFFIFVFWVVADWYFNTQPQEKVTMHELDKEN